MAVPARKIETEELMEGRIARLETHTEHILKDVQEIRQDVKGIHEKMDKRFSELDQKIDTKTKELDQKFDTKFGELMKTLESMKLGRAWDRVWMLLAMGALLSVMARGFKWI